MDSSQVSSRQTTKFRFAAAMILWSIALAPLLGDDPFEQNKSAAAVWQNAQAGKMGPFLFDPHVVVPSDIPSQAWSHQSEAVQSSLSALALDAGPGYHSKVLADGRYVLYGDLFKTGETVALIELPVAMEVDPYWNDGRLAFARLLNGKWELRGLWDISTVWRPSTWKSSPNDYLPVRPAEVPFELCDFDGDGIPEVIMAGGVSRYYQDYYLLRFNSKTKRLDLLAQAMGKPELHDGYIRLYYNSGHRSIFEEWDFAMIINGRMKEVGSWHDGEPYNPGDDEGPRVEAPIQTGELKLFKIANYTTEHFELTCDGNKVAEIDFSRKNSGQGAPSIDYDALESAWIFRHLTGLPRDLFPEYKNLPVPPFSLYLSASIKGDPETVRQLKKRGD